MPRIPPSHITLDDLPAGEHVAGLKGWVLALRDSTSQCAVALGLGLVMAEQVGLGEFFDLDGGMAGQ